MNPLPSPPFPQITTKLDPIISRGLDERLQILINKGYVERGAGDSYRLTDLGRIQADIVDQDLTTTLARATVTESDEHGSDDEEEKEIKEEEPNQAGHSDTLDDEDEEDAGAGGRMGNGSGRAGTPRDNAEGGASGRDGPDDSTGADGAPWGEEDKPEGAATDAVEGQGLALHHRSGEVVVGTAGPSPTRKRSVRGVCDAAWTGLGVAAAPEGEGEAPAVKRGRSSVGEDVALLLARPIPDLPRTRGSFEQDAFRAQYGLMT